MKKSIIVLIILVIILIGIINNFNINKKIVSYFYPKKYEEYIYQYSEELKIDPMLAFAIVKTESNFNERVESKSGAIGLMQLMENTAKEQAQKLGIEFSKEKLYYPEVNLKIGLNYFNSLLDYYKQNYILAFTAYNAGIGNVEKWIKEGTIKPDGSNIENIPFKETNLYVRKIIKNYNMYKKLYMVS